MFRWLTRNDGGRKARAARRLKSARGAVFSEFALVVPIVVLVCSALIELVGFWDAQVMANHAAWTVGRIVMVRGSDGLEFSSTISKKSKTGIEGSAMPDALKKALANLDVYVKGANRFNNRGNIATLFLMSTCGIGYFGASPGKTLSDMLQTLCDAAVKTLTEGIPEAIKDAIKNIKLPSFIPSGAASGIEKLVEKLVGTVLDKLVEAALKPIADGITSLLEKAVERIIGKDGINIDKWFGGEGGGARLSRQLFGAASRIARAESLAGKEVLTVTDMDSLTGNFMFAKNSRLKRLAYPLVVDKDATSDGYFVTGAHGWPANNNGLAMTHIEINWPYEYAWLFPIVSGYGTASSPPTLATGHSMVFPQPDISNENLYSEGASAYEEGAYTNNTQMSALDQLADDMKNYLKFVKFCMRFRICTERLTLGDEAWYAYSWKRCNELKELWGLGNGKHGGDYGDCWRALTDGKDQDSTLDTLEPYFYSSSYHNRDYFHWDGSYHRSYHNTLCLTLGAAGLPAWYNAKKPLNYLSNPNDNAYQMSTETYTAFSTCWERYRESPLFNTDDRAFMASLRTKTTTIYKKICEFANRKRVNVPHLVQWMEGHDYATWARQDQEVKEKSVLAEGSFATIKRLVEKEIIDIENMENGSSSWTGNEDDPVYDPNDVSAMKDPDAAAKKAQAKWEALKAKLREKLAAVDEAAVNLRNGFSAYANDANAFVDFRTKCINEGFAEACIYRIVKARSIDILNAQHDNAFSIPGGSISYDIGRNTREMQEKIKRYQDLLNDSYNKEMDYGASMGLESAGQAQREGKTPDQIVDEADKVDDDKPGSLGPGSDTGEIIDKDRQSYSGGRWIWN